MKNDPYRIQKPGDLYMVISPEGKIRSIAAGNMMYDNFREFSQDAVYYAKKKGATCQNDFHLHYRFKDDNDVPYWQRGENDAGYHQRVMDTIKEQGLKPYRTLRLYHAMYCFDNNLNPLLPQNSQKELEKRADYQHAMLMYSPIDRSSKSLSYQGIHTDKGVLLFDNTAKGEALQQKYMDFHIHHFFDPRLEITFLHIIDVVPDERQKEKANPSLDALYKKEPGRLGEVDPIMYTDIMDFQVSQQTGHYDMSPTGWNLALLSGMDKGESVTLPTGTYDILTLKWLADPACADPLVQDEFPNIFSYYEKFVPFEEKMGDAVTIEDRKKVMDEVRTLAKEILQTDFPDIRQPSPANSKAQGLDAVQKTGNSDTQLNPPAAGRKHIVPAKKKGGLSL